MREVKFKMKVLENINIEKKLYTFIFVLKMKLILFYSGYILNTHWSVWPSGECYLVIKTPFIEFGISSQDGTVAWHGGTCLQSQLCWMEVSPIKNLSCYLKINLKTKRA
jgi:hypothetical protein